MQIIPRIEEFHDDLVNWRHDIHAHPELGFEERRTSDLVAEKLAGFGCPFPVPRPLLRQIQPVGDRQAPW